jgi:hypothetical protein
MEESIFHSEKVLPELKRYVEVRLHVDRHRELAERKLQRLEGNQALPFYEIVDPRTGERIELFEGADLIDKGKNFAEFLRRNRAKVAF